jgi:hypothetical protein
MKILVLLKRTAAILIIAYGLVVLGMFAYYTNKVGALTAYHVTDMHIVSGPIRRLLMPLESDAAIIGRFVRDRQAYEELVAIHREKCFSVDDAKKNFFGEYPEVKLLKQRLGIVKLTSGTGTYWLPDPYSYKSRVQARQILNELLDLPQHEMRSRGCQHTAPKFQLSASTAHLAAKGLIYFPVPPRVKDGKLLLPGGEGAHFHYEEVLSSLDQVTGVQLKRVPGCTYRRIEPQWFLFVC